MPQFGGHELSPFALPVRDRILRREDFRGSLAIGIRALLYSRTFETSARVGT
jgi:hypothetical protein